MLASFLIGRVGIGLRRLETLAQRSNLATQASKSEVSKPFELKDHGYWIRWTPGLKVPSRARVTALDGKEFENCLQLL